MQQAARKGTLRLQGMHGSCTPQVEFLLTFYHQQQEETKPNQTPPSTLCLEMCSAWYSSSSLTHSAFHKTAGHNSAKLSANITRICFPVSNSKLLISFWTLHRRAFNIHISSNSLVQGNLSFFQSHTSKLNPLPSDIFKALSTFLGICYCTIPLTGTKICIRF